MIEQLIALIKEKTGHDFKDIPLLKQATTHPKYERLEFLGDRILGLVMAEVLFENFKDEKEGDLAKRHAHLVSTPVLTKLGNKIKLKIKTLHRTPSIIADCMEAVIAAIYLDGGLEIARKWILNLWCDEVSKDKTPPTDHKSELQEWLQGKGAPLPVYSTVGVEGSDHSPTFTIEAKSESHGKKAEGKGPSKRIAEQNAAKALLKELKDETT